MATAEPAQHEAVVRCVGITKFFGGVRALADVSVSMYSSEIVGLVGDNGAGKSTLIKVLSGLIKPDQGEIWFGPNRMQNLNPQISRALGIETVYQTLELCDSLDAPSNVFLGQEPIRFRLGPFHFIDRRRAEAETHEKITQLGIGLSDLGAPVRRLSGGQRQALAIARATVRGHRMIILDEPTAALGFRQTNITFDLIREVARRGVAVLLISHNLDQVLSVVDRVIALRLGQVTLDSRRDLVDRKDVEAMISGSLQ